jgi:outer membrane protein TolC
MRRSCLFLALALLVAAVLPGSARAQSYNYAKGSPQLPFVFRPYIPHHVGEPILSNSPRIDQLMKDGKIYLSLDDAIAMALENNLDLAIARYTLPIADTDILRARGGGTIRGVPTGVVQNTPGGGVGGFGSGAPGTGPGGTTLATGGAGAGAGGLATTTLGVGSAVDSYDPILTSNLSVEPAAFPTSNTVTSGVTNVNLHTTTANFGYFQGFGTGTAMNVTFQNQLQSTNQLFTFLSPQVTTGFRLTLRQHLLQGFGFGPNQRFIRIARNNREISDVAFRLQVITTVTQIENIYWDLVTAYEDLKVKERSLALAEKTLSDNQKQVEIGTLAPIEIVRAQSEVAARNQDLIVSQTALQLQELLMKNAITKVETDPTLAAAPVIPTDIMDVPAQEPVVPLQDLIKDALDHRPELRENIINLKNQELNKKSAANALLPTVDVVGWYGTSALGGTQNPAATCLNVSLDPSGCDAADAAAGRSLPAGLIHRTGFPEAFANTLRANNPDYGIALNVTIPIRNRPAQADQVRSELEYRQAQMRLVQQQNQIGIEVRNARFAVEQNRARVDAARKGRELAQQTLDAEQKKFQLGASTPTLVLQAQRDLAQAESNLVTAMSSYEKSRVELDRATGLTLSHLAIDMGDAESGVVTKMPSVPGVVRGSPDAPESTPKP